MKIKFIHTKAFDWETIKPSEAKDGDVLAQNAKGETVKRIVIDSPYTETTFSGGGIEAIHAEREAAGVSKKSDYQVVAHHLQDAVVPNHFELDNVTDIECDEDPALADFLKQYFQIKTSAGANQ